MAAAAANVPQVGDRIKLVGLASQAGKRYNNQTGWVTKVWPDQGKLKAALDNGQTFKVKFENVVVGKSEPPPDAAELMNMLRGFTSDPNVESRQEDDGSLSFVRRE